VRRLLIALVLTLAVLPAWSQDDQDLCGKENNDDSISGCTEIIQAKGVAPELLKAAYLARGLAYFRNGLWDKAIADYTKLIALKPKDLAVVYTGRSIAYVQKGLLDPAIADITRAIALQPNLDSYNIRAGAYEMKGQPDKAIPDYRAALKIEPTDQHAKDALKRLGAPQ
jgi:tetratricopeptide (TPR) repeat protein